jgi:transketolase
VPAQQESQSTAAALDTQGRADRKRILQILERSGRGHVGAAFSAMEIVRVLYEDVLQVDPTRPEAPERDRFIFSKGHGCLALYVMLAELGFIPEEELDRVCHFGAMLGGHPEANKIPGVEASTGALGHGLSIGVGAALAARIDGASWRTFVLVGDGESNEGSVWEAAMSAGKHRLESLTVLIDYNRFQSYGPSADIQDLEPFADKWRSFGFGVAEVDGHDRAALRSTLAALPVEPGRPTAVICHTVKGKGLAATEHNADWHHKSRVAPDELQALYAELDDR